MKKIHVNLNVNSIADSVQFYNSLFGMQATKVKEDYAKWQLDDPQFNFSISLVPEEPGVNHLGIEVEDEQELKELYKQIENTANERLEEGHTTCCYAHSEKSWVRDPQGILWEAFRTYGESATNKVHSEIACCNEICCES